MIKVIFKLCLSLPKYPVTYVLYHSSVYGFITCKQLVIHGSFWKFLHNKQYRSRNDLSRENVEGTRQEVFLSYAYPHKQVNSQRIQRIAWYVKLFLGMSEIDITAFATHSTQSVPTLIASNMGLSIKDSQKAAVWSGDSTFIKYYSLTILKNVGSEIVNTFKNNGTIC